MDSGSPPRNISSRTFTGTPKPQVPPRDINKLQRELREALSEPCDISFGGGCGLHSVSASAVFSLILREKKNSSSSSSSLWSNMSRIYGVSTGAWFVLAEQYGFLSKPNCFTDFKTLLAHLCFKSKTSSTTSQKHGVPSLNAPRGLLQPPAPPTDINSTVDASHVAIDSVRGSLEIQQGAKNAATVTSNVLNNNHHHHHHHPFLSTVASLGFSTASAREIAASTIRDFVLRYGVAGNTVLDHFKEAVTDRDVILNEFAATAQELLDLPTTVAAATKKNTTTTSSQPLSAERFVVFISPDEHSKHYDWFRVDIGAQTLCDIEGNELATQSSKPSNLPRDEELEKQLLKDMIKEDEERRGRGADVSSGGSGTRLVPKSLLGTDADAQSNQMTTQQAEQESAPKNNEEAPDSITANLPRLAAVCGSSFLADANFILKRIMKNPNADFDSRPILGGSNRVRAQEFIAGKLRDVRDAAIHVNGSYCFHNNKNGASKLLWVLDTNTISYSAAKQRKGSCASSNNDNNSTCCGSELMWAMSERNRGPGSIHAAQFERVWGFSNSVRGCNTEENADDGDQFETVRLFRNTSDKDMPRFIATFACGGLFEDEEEELHRSKLLSTRVDVLKKVYERLSKDVEALLELAA